MAGSAKLKVSARDGYQEFCKAKFGQFPERLNDIQRSKALGAFYIQEIYGRIHAEVPEEDFEDGWVDGSRDLDVDLIHRDNNRVLILQCRYRGAGKKEQPNDIVRFQSVLARIFNNDFVGNARLDDIVREIDWNNDVFDCQYITFGDISGQAFEQSQTDPILPSVEGIADRVDFAFHGESQLNELLRQALSLANGISDKDVTLVAAGAQRGRTSVTEFKSGEHRSCVLVVDATQLTSMYEQHKDSIFSLNIRNFLGNTRQNKKIIETARDRPEDFFYFNNGVSCIAESVEVKEDRVVAKKLQVINGAQTIKSLVRSKPRVGLPKSWLEQRPFVLVRITEVAKGYGDTGRLREEITRFNNTQNVIKDADFKANDPVHESIAKHFRETAHFGKKVIYQAKRTDAKETNSEVIRIDEFAKRVFAFLVDPIGFSGSTSVLYDDAKGYSHIFGDGESVWAQMPEAEFRLRAGIWWLAEAFTQLLKEERGVERSESDKKIYSHALERKWHVLFAARVLLERSFGKDRWRTPVERLYKGDWKIKDGSKGTFVNTLYQQARKAVVQVYRQASKAPDFNHRRWMRAEDTVEALISYVADVSDDEVASLAKGLL